MNQYWRIICCLVGGLTFSHAAATAQHTAAAGQGVVSVTTDQPEYAYGEVIEITVTISNPTQETFQLTGSSTCQAQFRLDEFDSREHTLCTADEVIIEFTPGSQRSWIWQIEPDVLGLPTTSGSHTIVGYYPGTELADTTTMEAPAFLGGRVGVGLAQGVSAADMAPVMDSLNAEVLTSYEVVDGRVETWQISGVTVDSAVTRYSGDDRFRFIEAIRIIQYDQIIHAAGTADYFPLDAGNTWNYITVLDPPDAPPDTLWSSYSIAETVSINDTLYYRSSYPFPLADTVRADDEGRILARIGGQEVLLFDFTLAEGETYVFEHPSQPDLNMHVEIERDVSFDVAAGSFENGVLLRFDVPQAMDAGRTFAFAPGVGIVYAYDGGGDYQELHSAEVDGQIITETEEPASASLDPEAVSAYPNPFSSSVTIALEAAGMFPATATVHDVLGRRITVLAPSQCDMRRCTFEWSAPGIPSGTYYVRLQRGESAHTVGLVLSR